jgi:hypothetical protein
MAKTNFFSKGIAFVTVAALTLSALPTVDSFASSTNKLSNGNITVSEKTMFYEPGLEKPTLKDGQSTVKYFTEGNYLNIKLDDAIVSSSAGKYPSFDLELENAKFAFQDYSSYTSAEPFDKTVGKIVKENDKTVYSRDVKSADKTVSAYSLEIKGDDYATVTLAKDYAKDETIKIPMIVRMNDDLTKGTAKVSIRGGNSGISSSTLSLATINKGSTTTYVNDYQTAKNRIKIKELIIKENVAGSMNPAEGEGFYLELPSGYYFTGTPALSYINLNGELVEGKANFTSNSRKIEFVFKKGFETSKSQPGRIVIKDLFIVSNSSSDSVTKEDIKINIDNIGSGEMVTAQEFKAGTRADYGVSFKTSGTVPTILNGFYDETSKTNDKVKSVKLVVSEETVGSLLDTGNLVLTLSDNAKICAVKIEDQENIKESINKTYELNNKNNEHVEVKESKVILRDLTSSSTSSTKKASFAISFYLSIESGYVGDVSVKISGDAVRNASATEPIVIAKAIDPVSTNLKTTYFTPGQTVVLDDIVLTEQLNSKGYSALEEGKVVKLGFDNNNYYLSIVGTPTIRTENGLKVKNVKTSTNNKDGVALSFTIDEASSKDKVSKIIISGLKVAASASTPKGTYSLLIGGPAVAGNSTSLIGTDSDKASFATDGIKVANLQYGGDVSMKITIGSRIVNINGQEIEMKLAPFIDPATGTTYMQVSDIVKATGRTCSYIDTRLQPVEGLNANLYVTFGDRTFEKDKSTVRIYGQTIPETMTNEQGMPVNMIVKDDYTCLPLRYFVEKVLGQKISWNGTDNTVTIE